MIAANKKRISLTPQKLIYKIKHSLRQLNTKKFQDSLYQLVTNLELDQATLHLFNSLITYYGFTVSLLFSQFYHKFNPSQLLQFNEDLRKIDINIRQQVSYKYENLFPEINYFKGLVRKSQIKMLMKKSSKEFDGQSDFDSEMYIKNHLLYNGEILKLAQIQNKLAHQRSFTNFRQIYEEVKIVNLKMRQKQNQFQTKFRMMINIKISNKIERFIDSHSYLQEDVLKQFILAGLSILKEDYSFQIKHCLTKQHLNDSKQKEELQNVVVNHNIVKKKSKRKKNRSKKNKKNKNLAKNQIKSDPIQYVNVIQILQQTKSQQYFSQNDNIDYIICEESIPLCQKTFFYEDEIILEAQSIERQYKSYSLPLRPIQLDILKKTITAFLNTVGGIIYIGIKEHQNRLRTVKAIPLNQAKKHKLQNALIKIGSSIEPNDISNPLYKIQYIPVQGKSAEQAEIDRYVIKIVVRRGDLCQLYSYQTDEGWMISFRTQNQVLVKDPKKDFRKIYQLIKQRVSKSSSQLNFKNI